MGQKQYRDEYEEDPDDDLFDKLVGKFGFLIQLAGIGVAIWGVSVLLGVGVDEDKDLAKITVRSQCMSLDPAPTAASFGMMPMSINVAAFGQKKVDEWCACAYDKVSKVFTDEQIASSSDAGMYDPITEKMAAAVTLATAVCIKESTLPAEGRKHADSYADLLVQSYQAKVQMSNALQNVTR